MSRAWFALAVAGVMGLFYMGYAMVQGQEVEVRPIFGPELKQPDIAAKLKWEMLAGNAAPNTQYRAVAPSRVFRSKIPGGWLVESYRPSQSQGTMTGNGVGLTFVPDPEHKWDGSSLP